MLIKTLPITDLAPAEYNPRKDLQPGDPEFDKLKRSLDEFGYVEPVIFNTATGHVVGGHQRLKDLASLGYDQIECVVVELDETREKALNIALNKISGDWDTSKLALLIADLDASDFDAELTGFDDTEIASLIGSLDEGEVSDDGFDLTAALEEAGVAVRFERERIDTLTADGEVLLTLLALFAQAESESISANTTWGIRSKYPHGRPHSRRPYGYHLDHGMLRIISIETSIVKRVFDEFLAGHSPEATVERLNAEGLRSRSGAPFRASVTRTWLENPTYIGTLICQDYYRPHIANPTGTRNTGQLPKYIITDHHTPTGDTNALTHRIRCTTCGKHYQRRTKTRSGRTYKYWWCETATKGHGNPCGSHQLREIRLQDLITIRLGLPDLDDATIVETITRIDAGPDHQLTAHLRDGSTAPLDYPANGKEAC